MPVDKKHKEMMRRVLDAVQGTTLTRTALVEKLGLIADDELTQIDSAIALNKGEEKDFGYVTVSANHVARTCIRRLADIPEEMIENWTLLGPRFREIIAETESVTDRQARLENPSPETTYVELVHAFGG